VVQQGDHRQPARRANFFLQGLVVALSNPKTLLFFGAFFPQFIDPAGHHGLQILVMGITAMAVAAASDGAYAVVAGRAANALSAGRLRLMSRIGGSVLIGGGLWLALSRSR
jgi:threonine/homoserine/homoserine lactone efflux protein